MLTFRLQKYDNWTRHEIQITMFFLLIIYAGPAGVDKYSTNERSVLVAFRVTSNIINCYWNARLQFYVENKK